MELKSTYGLRKDWSYRSETFFIIPLTWRLGVSKIELLKIRVASWRPKYDRTNQSIFYFDVNTKDEALEIIEKNKDFDFKKIENFFEKMYLNRGQKTMNTGETEKWLNEIVIPKIREKFKINN